MNIILTMIPIYLYNIYKKIFQPCASNTIKIQKKKYLIAIPLKQLLWKKSRAKKQKKKKPIAKKKKTRRRNGNKQRDKI